MGVRASPVLRRSDRQALDAESQPNGESNHVVGGSDLLRRSPDPWCDLRVALRCTRQQTVSDLRGDLGDRNLSQQLDEPHRRLLQGAACVRPSMITVIPGTSLVFTVFRDKCVVSNGIRFLLTAGVHWSTY